MGQELTKIKKRINSVTGAYKVTSAMKLVSTVKLKKWKNKMLANKEYSKQIEETKDMLLMCSKDVKSPFFTSDSKQKRLFIIVSSTLGLCGSYNNSLFKLADVSLKKEDSAIILGAKGLAHFENGEFTHIDEFMKYSSVADDSVIHQLTNFIMSEFSKGVYSEIHIIYSEYKNSLVFTPKDYTILPLNSVEYDDKGYPPIMEPSPQAVLDALIPIYIKTTLYAKLLESEVCEQAARSNAMENATKNAEELLSDLKIEFNKARQGAITQEIIEIVGAAEAL